MSNVKFEILKNAVAVSTDRGIRIKDIEAACEVAKVNDLHQIKCLSPIWGEVALELGGWESFMEDHILTYEFNY